MTTPRHFESDLPALLTDLYLAGTPDYRDDLVRQTALVRQRPAWIFPERWLPVELVTSRVPSTRMPWRQLGVVALIALLLAAVLAAYVGSQQRHLPAPFGPAANGVIVFEQGGDIYAADPETGVTKALVTGAGLEVGPVYSPDGTRLLFKRGGALFVGRDDGSGLVQLNQEPLVGLAGWGFSPDGRSVVAFATGAKGPEIIIAKSDGQGQPQHFPVFATDDAPPTYRPDGSEILFIGQDPSRMYRGLYALVPATSAVRTLIAPQVALDLYTARWSSDGSRIAYAVQDHNMDVVSTRTHVVNSDGTGDIAIDADPRSIADGNMVWSNDGTHLVVTRFYSTDDSVPTRNVILPVDRSSNGIEIECPPDDCIADWSWSPDDSTLLGSIERQDGTFAIFLADAQTGQVRSVPWSATGHPSWQRVAP
jgi:Tol biopolymer transport system component